MTSEKLRLRAADDAQREWRVVLLYLAAIGILPLLAITETGRKGLGLAPAPLAITLSPMVIVILVTTGVFHRWGGDSRLYRTLNWIETLVVEATIFAALWQVHGAAFSPFWVVYFLHIVGLALEMPRTNRTRLLFAAGPFALLVGLLIRGEYTNAIVTVGIGLGGLALSEMVLQTSNNLTAVVEERDRISAELMQLSLRAERERIARDLHDGLAAELVAMFWRAQRMSGTVRDDELRTAIDTLAARASGGIQELRSVVWALRVPDRPWQELVAFVVETGHELCGEHIALLVEASDAEYRVPGELSLSSCAGSASAYATPFSTPGANLCDSICAMTAAPSALKSPTTAKGCPQRRRRPERAVSPISFAAPVTSAAP
jgi:hypothetical protein